MASGWRQYRAGMRRALSETFGLTGARVRNIAAWAVAGTLAYYLWVKPQQREEQERKEALERRRQFLREKGLEEVDRIRPTPDPQRTGLLRGHRPRPEVENRRN